MSRKREVVLAVVIILVLCIVLALLFWRKNTSETTDTTKGTLPDTTTTTTTETPTAPAPVTHATAATVGRTFVERFGSYSTEVDYANVDDVMPLVTPSLQTRLQSLAIASRKTPSDTYYGVSTNVIKMTTDEVTDTTTTITVKTQREEAFDSPANTRVRYQDIRLTFKKIGEDWLVDDFVWL